MPYKPARPCRFARCAAFAVEDESYCVSHLPIAVEARKQQDRDRGNSWTRGYDHDWKRLRDHHFRSNPLCVSCLKNGRIEIGEVVDHIQPIQGRNDPRRLDPGNLQTLCVKCHAVKTSGTKVA